MKVVRGCANTSKISYELAAPQRGSITEGKSSKTNITGVFAAGDVQDSKYQQAITAAGSGAIAALDAKEYLNENE